MNVYGIKITDDQIAAAIGAMQGDFTLSDVRRALVQAGVLDKIPVPDRAADRLLQRERKAGRILAISNKIWTVA